MQVVQKRFHSNKVVYYWLVSCILKLFLTMFVLCTFVNHSFQQVFSCVDWSVHGAGGLHTALLCVGHGAQWAVGELVWPWAARGALVGHSVELAQCGAGTVPLLGPGTVSQPGSGQPSPLGLLQKEQLLWKSEEIFFSLEIWPCFFTMHSQLWSLLLTYIVVMYI